MVGQTVQKRKTYPKDWPAYREAARLGTTKVAFAPLIRDQGNDKLPTGDVARCVVRGLLLARDTDVRLQKEGLTKKSALEEWIEEAGASFIRTPSQA